MSESVVKKLEDRTCDLGFKRVKGLLRKPLNADASVGVGYLPKTFPSGLVTVFVVVSLRFESIYQLGLKLGAYPKSDGNASLSAGLNYLVPSGVVCEYEFLPDVDNNLLFDRVIRDTMTHGVTTFDRLTNVELALDAVEKSTLQKAIGDETFVPLALLFLGRKAEAIAIAKNYLSKMNPTRGNGKSYDEFVKALNLTA